MLRTVLFFTRDLPEVGIGVQLERLRKNIQVIVSRHIRVHGSEATVDRFQDMLGCMNYAMRLAVKELQREIDCLRKTHEIAGT